MNVLKNLSTAAILFAAVGAAQAAVVTGNFNSNGYDIISINVAIDAVVDFRYISGYDDPVFSLFNASGAHLITNDDIWGPERSRYSHLTQSLAAGNYSLVVSECCGYAKGLPGFHVSSTDGYNFGSYYTASTSLNSFISQLYRDPTSTNTTYTLTMQNADLVSNNVPEPGSVALFGASIGALAMARRRKQKGSRANLRPR